jgi:transposase
MLYQRKSRMAVRPQQKWLEHFVALRCSGSSRKLFRRRAQGAAGKRRSRESAGLWPLNAWRHGIHRQYPNRAGSDADSNYPREGHAGPHRLDRHVYDVLDVSEFHHRRVHHSKVFVSTRGHHINGIENCWSQAKRPLRRFHRIPKDSCYWFLKECDGRFNGGDHAALLHQLKSWYRAAVNRS